MYELDDDDFEDEDDKLQDQISLLLDEARAGNARDLIAHLDLLTREQHRTSTPGIPLTETEKLLDEALWYARHGDLSEAIYRLEQTAP